MKKIALFISVLLAPLFLSAQEASIDAGIEAYSNADYATAVDFFRTALEQSSEPTAALHYNLGCAYYKSGELASAILHFERAYRIDPADADIRFNLKLASSQIVDKMEPLPTFSVNRWLDSMAHWFRLSTWRAITTLFFILFVAGAVTYVMAVSRSARRTGFIAGIVSLLLFAFSLHLAYRLDLFIYDETEAIVMQEVVTVKSSPDASATDIVVIHSGLKVTCGEEILGYTEVNLPDGTIGWLPSDSFERIIQ